jgi:hypothetical protein
MAKFKLTNFEIKKIEKGPNKGNNYMIATAINTLFIRDVPQTITEFNQAVIDQYKPYILESKGGEAKEEIPMPDQLQYTNGHVATYAPPKELIPFTKIYVVDGTHYVNGVAVPHKAGETVVNKYGEISLYEDIKVFCEYWNDPDFPGIPQYPKGGDPSEKGQTYFNNFCKAYRSNQPIATDEGTEVGSIPQEPANTRKTVIGYDPKTGQPIYE